MCDVCAPLKSKSTTYIHTNIWDRPDPAHFCLLAHLTRRHVVRLFGPCQLSLFSFFLFICRLASKILSDFYDDDRAARPHTYAMDAGYCCCVIATDKRVIYLISLNAAPEPYIMIGKASTKQTYIGICTLPRAGSIVDHNASLSRPAAFPCPACRSSRV